jgi:hypothetical protein
MWTTSSSIVNTGPAGVGLLDSTTLRWISRPSAAQVGLVGYFAAWSHDGSLVASVNEGRLSYWNGRTGARMGTTTVGWDGDVAFSKDGETLLVAGDQRSVDSWKLDPRSWVAAACRLAGRPLQPSRAAGGYPLRHATPLTCGCDRDATNDLEDTTCSTSARPAAGSTQRSFGSFAFLPPCRPSTSTRE